jgi:ectoine hydroxylase-related dioxygenase (phytanoyl-CoA dioxygenase family)
MGRGERERLFTAWTPMGDVDFEQGGLMILEGSHRHQKLKSTYGTMDVDAFCENKPDAKSWGKSWGTGGSFKANPNQIRKSLGGRWLTSEFRMGDVLIFSVFTLHASLDNRSNQIRLSSDSRYQPAGLPTDERWIGPNPVGHGEAGKRGKLC